MKNDISSELVNTSIELRNFFTKSNFGLDELRRIFIATPVSDYIKPRLHISRKRKLQKRISLFKVINLC